MNTGTATGELLTDSGLAMVGELPWGANIGHCYRAGEDLLAILLPYFAAGLRGGEKCLWITDAPLTPAAAAIALGREVPDIDQRVAEGQMEIVAFDDLFDRESSADPLLSHDLVGRERSARRAGFRGLRIATATSGLSSRQWPGFVAASDAFRNEARRGRILLLNSYDLGGRTPEQLAEALRTHDFTLVRGSEGWELTQSIERLLDCDAQSVHRNHAIHFLGAEFDSTPVVDFLLDGAAGPETALFVVARRPHLIQIEAELEAAGLDLARARREQRLLTIDAEEAARALPPSAGRRDAFHAALIEPVEAMAERAANLRGYGELVDLLLETEGVEAALAVEQWWNECLERRPLALLCGYDASRLDADPVAAERLCAQHGSAHQPGDNALARTLIESERQARVRMEKASRHLAQLQRMTSSLSVAVSTEQIARVVAKEIPRVLGADVGVLGVADVDAVRLLGVDPQCSRIKEVARLSRESPDPLALSLRSGSPSWIEDLDRGAGGGVAWEEGLRTLAVVPVGLGKLGVVAFGYRIRRTFDASDRVRLADLSRQVGLALDRARLFEDLERERTRAEAANEAKDEFLAMLGHELRNPLAPITTALELMRLQLNDQCEKERSVIQRQVGHMTRLVDDLLDMSRFSRGKIQLHKAPVLVTEVLMAAVETVSPLLEQASHRLDKAFPDAPLWVIGDVQRLSQAVGNLLDNAAKYTAPGGLITVGARCADAERLQITVRDTGVGIESDQLEHLFQAFVQGSTDPLHKAGGLGVGLAIVRSIVEMHGGRVFASSDGVGRGAEFVIDLPSAPAPQDVCWLDGPEQQPAPPTEAFRRILVVDDNRDAADALGALLRALGHEARVAYDGPQALRAVADFRPEVALLDLGLPVMDGYELAQRLQEILAESRPMLIALSGYAMEAHRERSRAVGFDAHLAKPLRLDGLLDLLAGPAVEST